MLTQYTYIKPRYQFGKQCIFLHTKNIAEENIWPDPALMQNYILRTHCQHYAQVSSLYAAHEAQTARRILVNTGVLHQEGGWPKEINARDTEVVQRFRRRTEKSENWPTCMNRLLTTMERYVLQNNAVNIHQNFFDDLIPTSMVKDYNMRVINLYEDPQTKMRPIRHLSWSSIGSNRLAAAYGFLEFEEHPTDASPHSYVWDIENPNKTLNTLKSSIPLTTAEFNARDPVLLVSGLVSGQVCCWDIRTSEHPAQISHVYKSHRHPVTQTLWIPSKANTDFFSSSTDGMVMWWDSRYLRKPTETLVIDLESPSRASLLKAVGVTTLQFESTLSSRFLAGTENGTVLSVNRRGQNPLEKLAMRFECYTGPVVAIDRNPIYTKNFLTIGDWCAKIWSEDTKEGFFLSTCNKDVDLSGGCWSRSRCSVFYTISKNGSLDAYDILAGVRAPLSSIRLCGSDLTAISSHEDGELLAVGSRNGGIYLLECSQDLTTLTKDERSALNNYFERCSRYEKAIDNRLKEIRLNYVSSPELPLVRIQDSKAKAKKKDQKEKEKKKERSGSVTKERRESRESRKKSKAQRPKGKSTVKHSSPHLMEAEINYFLKIEEEAMKFEPLDEADQEAAQKLLMERMAAVPQQEEADTDKDDLKKIRSVKRFRSRTRPIRPPPKGKEETEEELTDDTDSILLKKRGARERKTRILKKSCAIKVCKPKICCADMEEKRRVRLSRRPAEEVESEEAKPERSRSIVLEDKSFRRLTDYLAALPAPSRAFQRKMLALRSAPPNILRVELEEAKRELREWQEKAIAKRLSSWTIERKLDERAEKSSEVGHEPGSETGHDVPKEGHTAEKHVAATVEPKRPAAGDRKPDRKKSRGRKSRKLKLAEEDLQKQEEEKQKELWNLLKKKVIQYDELHKLRQYYPRISAAFGRSSLGAIEDTEERNA